MPEQVEESPQLKKLRKILKGYVILPPNAAELSAGDKYISSIESVEIKLKDGSIRQHYGGLTLPDRLLKIIVRSIHA